MSSLSLSLYFTLARARSGQVDYTPSAERPDGQMLWLHAGAAEDARALERVAEEVQGQRPDLRVVQTGATARPCDLVETVPPDTIPAAQIFLKHWRPDLLMWSGSALRPALLAATGCPRFLLNAGADIYTAPSSRLLPDPVPATLNVFTSFFAASEENVRLMRRQGVHPMRVQQIGALSEADAPPACSDALQEEVATLIGPRPAWLAAGLCADEAAQVMAAHDRASRFAHRLLLIAAPADPAETRAIAASARDCGLRVAFWDEGEMPDDSTQVLLCEGCADLGLWYRLAPVTFMGASLSSGHGGRSPLDAAALGSAILFGPNVRAHRDAYTRLNDLGGARRVTDAGALAIAVRQSVAPDRAAAMAMAAWDLVSAGAAAVDTVAAAAIEVLDAAETP